MPAHHLNVCLLYCVKVRIQGRAYLRVPTKSYIRSYLRWGNCNIRVDNSSNGFLVTPQIFSGPSSEFHRQSRTALTRGTKERAGQGQGIPILGRFHKERPLMMLCSDMGDEIPMAMFSRWVVYSFLHVSRDGMHLTKVQLMEKLQSSVSSPLSLLLPSKSFRKSCHTCRSIRPSDATHKSCCSPLHSFQRCFLCLS